MRKFFPAANTPYGFFSRFDSIYNEKEDKKVIYIKGGSGTGKSTLMKKLTAVADERNDSGDYPYELSFSYGYAQFTVGKEKDSDGFMKRMDDNMYEYKVAKKARWAAEGKKTKQEEATTVTV